MSQKNLPNLKEQVDSLSTVVIDLNVLLDYTNDIEINPSDCDVLQNVIIGLISLTQLKLDKIKILLNNLTD